MKKMSKEELDTVHEVVNSLYGLDLLDSFWYPFTIEIILDNLRNKYLNYDDDEYSDDSEKVKDLKSKIVEWVDENDGIVIIDGEYFTLVKEFDYWLFGKINTDNLETAKKIILLLDKLYKIVDDLYSKEEDNGSGAK